VKGFAENLFESGLEGQLDGGVRILALPAVEVGTAVGEGEFEGLRFQWGTEGRGDRLQATGHKMF